MLRFTRIILLLCVSFLLSARVDKEKVQAFVAKHGLATGLSSAVYTNFIVAGEKKIKSLGGAQKAFNRSAYIQDIVHCMWYLYAIAVTKGEGFKGGTIVVEDPDKKLYNFLLTYVEAVNKAGMNKPVVASTNPYAYARKSTHFNDVQKKYIQYGIDIRLEDGGKSQPILPSNAKHILFGRINENYMFVKFESHGLYVKEGLAGHTGGLAKSIGRKIASKVTGGKSEDPLARRESMPQMLKKEYEKICKENKLVCKAKTVKDIFAQSTVDGQLVPVVQSMLKNWKYDPATLNIRYGNEVILTQRDVF